MGPKILNCLVAQRYGLIINPRLEVMESGNYGAEGSSVGLI